MTSVNQTPGGHKFAPLVAIQQGRANQHEPACFGLSSPWSFPSRSGIPLHTVVYSISRAASIASDCCRLPTTSVLSNKADKLRSNQFYQQVQVFQGQVSRRNKKECTRVKKQITSLFGNITNQGRVMSTAALRGDRAKAK